MASCKLTFLFRLCFFQHQCVCNDITATSADASVEAPVSSPSPVTVTTPAPVAVTTQAPVTAPSLCTTDGDCDGGRCFQGICFSTNTSAKQSLDTSRGGAAGGAKAGNAGTRRRLMSG